MRFYLGVTDNHWFSFLSKRINEDINFWQPGGNTSFKVLKQGAPFLFKLKSPINAIGGLGFFSSHSILPLNVAWDIFEKRNGLDSFFKFREKIINYRNSKNPFHSNPNIGCIVLTDPIFFEKHDWIEIPTNWHRSIVQGKSYSTEEEIGKNLWHQIELKLEKYNLFDRDYIKGNQLTVNEPIERYSKKYLTKVRLGQGAFRVQLTDAYNRKCAITGEKTLPALEAAHIKKYSESGPNKISNGILLRADVHKLFDSGYVTITSNYEIEISRKIKEEFENGKDYYKHHGQKLVLLPNEKTNQPDVKFIDWHNQNIYKG